MTQPRREQGAGKRWLDSGNEHVLTRGPELMDADASGAKG